MENIDKNTSDPISEQFMTLFQRVISLRYKLILPENINQFKQQVIECLQKSNLGSADDYRFVMRILVVLANREKPPTMGEISTELNTPLSTATRIIEFLVQSQIVERVSDPEDRRIVRIGMSATGQEFYQSFLDYNKKRIEKLMSHFSVDEQIQFIKLTSKLLDLLIADSGI